MVLRLISNGHSTYLEIDGKVYGEDIDAVYFMHDTKSRHAERPVLCIRRDDGIVYDSRFDDKLPDFSCDVDYDERERVMLDHKDAYSWKMSEW